MAFKVDIACVLALMQEAAVDSTKRKEGRRFESSFHRTTPKLAFLLPTPLIDKHQESQYVEDRRSVDTHRTSSSYDKLWAFKQYKQAKGLYDRCVERWTYGHKCTRIVQLHVIQELWDLFPNDELSANSRDSAGASEELAQLCAFLSEAPISGVESARSMRLIGNIQGHQVLMLVDSGRSHSFVSSTMAM
jgi:hypothetical protein